MKKNDKNLMYIGIAAVAVFFLWQGGYLANLNTSPPVTTGTVAVHDNVQVTLMDHIAGAALTSKTILLYQNGLETESLTTDSHGQATSSLQYDSGAPLQAYIADGNAHYWTDIVLPRETQAQADNGNDMQVTIQGYTAETYTDLVVCGATSYGDASSFNRTATPTPTISYDWNPVTANRAMLPGAFDPIYSIQPATMLFAVFNDTSIIVTSGFDGSYIVGSSKVYYKVLNADDFTYQTSGSTIVHPGTGAATFSLDTTSLPAVGTSNCTMQLYIFAFANAGYAQSHSASGATATAYGPLAVQLAEQTVTLNNG